MRPCISDLIGDFKSMLLRFLRTLLSSFVMFRMIDVNFGIIQQTVL
jgi:hypothetical protein